MGKHSLSDWFWEAIITALVLSLMVLFCYGITQTYMSKPNESVNNISRTIEQGQSLSAYS